MTISFTATSPISIPNAITDSSGKYQVSGLSAPSTAGLYSIMAQFAGSSLYKSINSTTNTLTAS